MNQIEIIESLAMAMYSDECPDQSATGHILEWLESDSIDNIINISIVFLSTKINEKMLFFAATCIREKVRNKWNEFPPELQQKLTSFLCNYIVTHLNNQQSRSYTFIIITLSDIVVLTEGFPIQQVFSMFPVDIQIKICRYYFEEWGSKFYNQILDKSYFSVPDYIIEYSHNILQVTNLSQEWIELYNNFAMGLESFQPLVIYMPKLFEAAKIIPLSHLLIKHISEVLEKDMIKGPDEYHFAVVNLSVELSINLRETIRQNSENYILKRNLISLWEAVLNLEDSDDFFLDTDFLPITFNLIEEFKNAGRILIELFQIEDIEFWPDLMMAAMKFCENFNINCPIANFSINVLEFVIAGLDFGVQLSEIKCKLWNFYDASKFLFDKYFVNPDVKSPTLLLIVAYLYSHREMRKGASIDDHFPTELSNTAAEEHFPREIIELYCNNLQSFNAPPLIQIYFSKQLIVDFPDFIPLFVNVFIQFFNDHPFECSNGLFIALNFINFIVLNNPGATDYSSLFNPTMIQQLTGMMGQLPFKQQEFIIPLIILLIIRIPSEQAAPIYSSLIQVIVGNFMEALQSQNKHDLLEFFDDLHKITQNIFKIFFVNEEPYKMFISFGQQVFSVISGSLQEIWMEPSDDAQWKLALFVNDFLQMNFVPNTEIVANWVNEIITIAPCSIHISIIYYLTNYIQLLPNVPRFIKELDQIPKEHSNIRKDFTKTILLLVMYLAPKWSDAFWIIIPPEFVFAEVLDKEKALNTLAIKAMNELVINPKIPVEFKGQVLKTIVQGCAAVYKDCSNELFEIVVNLNTIFGIQQILTAFLQAIPMSEEEQQLFVNIFMSDIAGFKQFLNQLLERSKEG